MARRKDDDAEQVADDVSASADNASQAARDTQDATTTPKRRASARRAGKAAGQARKQAGEAGSVETEDEARRAEEAARQAAAEAGLDPDDPLLDTAIRQIEAGATDDKPFGEPGDPIAPRSPFRIAFMAALGVAAVVLLAEAVIAVRGVLVLIAVSAFLAIGLNPAVESLQRRGLRRGLAVLAVVGLLIGFVVAFIAAAAPPVATQATDLVQEIPDYLEDLRSNSTFRDLDNRYDLVDKAKEATSDGISLTALGGVLGVARGIFNALFTTFTVLILTIYFLGSYPNLKRTAYRVVPRSRRPRVGLLADEILARVGGYVLGNIATSIVAGVVTLIALLVLGVPYPVALAMLVALLDLVPLVGATFAAFAVTIVAFTVSVPIGLITLVFYVLYQQFENYMLIPRVMKRTVDVAPVATIIAVLIGGTLLGVVGALLAIPVAAAVQLVCTEVLIPRQDRA